MKMGLFDSITIGSTQEAADFVTITLESPIAYSIIGKHHKILELAPRNGKWEVRLQRCARKVRKGQGGGL